jgi:hypothetical protein
VDPGSATAAAGGRIALSGTGFADATSGLAATGTYRHYRLCAFDRAGNISTGATRSTIAQ